MSKRETYESLGLVNSLSVPGFAQLSNLPESPDPIVRTRIIVTLDKLKPYDRNPRRRRNPLYAEIKESIRARGLDNPPSITRRPGEEFFIINNGGNTRIEILGELYQETNDRKYFEIGCDFVPWENEAKILAGHLIENDLRGDISLIDRALSLRDLLNTVAYEAGIEAKEIGIRDYSRRLEAMGYAVSPSILSRLFQALDLLYPYIPEAMHGGMGKPQVEKILGLRTALLECWNSRGLEEPQFAPAFAHALSHTDSENWSADSAQEFIVRDLCTQINSTYADLLLEVEVHIGGKKISKRPKLVSEKNDEISSPPITSNNQDQSPQTADQSAVLNNAVTGDNVSATPESELPATSPLSATSTETNSSDTEFESIDDPMAIDNAALQALISLEACCSRISSDVDVLRDLLASKAQCFASMISDSQDWIIPTPGHGIGFTVCLPFQTFSCDAIKAR